MPGRGRPKLTDDQKAVNDWDARLPAEPERRCEILDGLRRKEETLREQTKEIRDEIHVSGEVKRLTSVFGIRKAAINVKRIIDKLGSPEEVTAVWHQVQMMASDFKWDSAPGLFDITTIGKTAPENGSIFDKTSSGEKQASERGDDPGRARKRGGKGAAPAPVDTGKLSDDEALAVFEANKDKAPKPPGAADEDEADLRPRFMRQGGDEPKGLGPDAIH